MRVLYDASATWDISFMLNELLPPHPSTKVVFFTSLNDVCFAQPADVFIFSCNNYSYVDILAAVRRVHPAVIIHISDEWGTRPDYMQLACETRLLLRQHYHAKYPTFPNVYYIPLGYMNGMFEGSSVTPTNADRTLVWSFVGNIKADRQEMIDTFSAIGPHFHGKQNVSQMRELYQKSQFVPNGRGNVTLDCFRLYEASACGAIPVVVGTADELSTTFKHEGNPPWVFAPSWPAALEKIKALLATPGAVEKQSQQVLIWWQNRVAGARNLLDPVLLPHPKISHDGSRTIVDCFVFYNELEMLDFRLKELDSIVDYFVLVESTKTFAGNPKRLYFEQNKARYTSYSTKIIHVIVDDLPETTDPWVREHWQRSAITRGLAKLDLGADDIVIISDVDEIADVDRLVAIKTSGLDGLFSLEQDLYYYNLTNCFDFKWNNAKILNYATYVQLGKTPAELRIMVVPTIPKGGWHFSFFGNVDMIINKIKEFSHQEYNKEQFVNVESITNLINEHKDLFHRNMNLVSIPLDKNTYLPKNYHMLVNIGIVDKLVKQNESSEKVITENDFALFGKRSDKVYHHGYQRFYHSALHHLRDKSFGMLEIGIDQGYSLNLWKNYFPLAFIYGIDIGRQYTDERTHVFQADQSNVPQLQKCASQMQPHPILFINDDGSHIPEHQVVSFDYLFSNVLQPGGVYIIEDIEVSFWKNGKLYGYNANYGWKNSQSIIEKFLPLAYYLNREFVGSDIHSVNNSVDFSDDTKRQISSITFAHNCIIIKKKEAYEFDYDNRTYRFAQFTP